MSGKFILAVVVLVGGLVGYYLWNQVPPPPKDATLGGYVNTLNVAEQKAKSVASADNVKEAQGAIERYKVDKGTNPPSLQDLVPMYMERVPGNVAYDPGSGTVTAAP